MNVKEIMEIVNYLKEKREDAMHSKQLWEQPIENADDNLKEHADEYVKKYGTEVALVSHFIRLMEGIEVTR